MIEGNEPNPRQYLDEWVQSRHKGKEHDPRYGDRESTEPTCRTVTEKDHAGWRFFQSLFLGLAFVACTGVSWGMAGLMQWTLLALLLTWLFWISTFLFLFVYSPHVAWWAYKRGVFD